VEAGLPELMSKARGQPQHLSDLVALQIALTPIRTQVDGWQANVAALTADLRHPLSTGSRPAAGLASGSGCASAFENAHASARAPSAPQAKAAASLSRVALKPSTSWRDGDGCGLVVGESRDELEPREPSPPPPPQRITAPVAAGDCARAFKPASEWRSGDPLSQPERPHRPASAKPAPPPPTARTAAAASAPVAQKSGAVAPSWWPARAVSPAKPAALRRQKKAPSAQQLAYEAALYTRVGGHAPGTAPPSQAGPSDDVSGRPQRRSVAFEVPLQPGAPPLLLRGGDGSSSALAAAATPRVADARGGGGAPQHLRALQAAEAEYEALVAEATQAERKAAMARDAASRAVSAALAVGGSPAGGAAPWSLRAAQDAAAQFFRDPWMGEFSAPAAATVGVAGGEGKPQRRSWSRTYSSAGPEPPAEPAVAAHGGAWDAHDAPSAGASGSSFLGGAPSDGGGPSPGFPLPLAAPSQQSYVQAMQSLRWQPHDASAFSDSDVSDDDDAAALAAVLRAARTASEAAGEAAALTAAAVANYGTAAPAGGDSGLAAGLAAWRATASPAKAPSSGSPSGAQGPLRALLATWRAGEGAAAEGWGAPESDDDDSEE